MQQKYTDLVAKQQNEKISPTGKKIQSKRFLLIGWAKTFSRKKYF